VGVSKSKFRIGFDWKSFGQFWCGGNTGITDLELGFEIAVLKSQIGYVAGDIKFFAFTMKMMLNRLML
jgi:hypothetical protein